ncbi:hypothetical protein FCV25MIE_18856, partial [Fagus crenata]
MIGGATAAFTGVETSTEISDDITAEVAQDVAAEAFNNVARGTANKITMKLSSLIQSIFAVGVIRNVFPFFPQDKRKRFAALPSPTLHESPSGNTRSKKHATSTTYSEARTKRRNEGAVRRPLTVSDDEDSSTYMDDNEAGAS